MVISVLITFAIQQYGLHFLIGPLTRLTLNLCLGFTLGESIYVRISTYVREYHLL